MKAQLLLAGIILGMSGISACTGNKKNVMTEKETMEVWKDYPVCPGTDQYVLGAPYFPYLKLRLPNGNILEIKAEGVSDTRRYVQSLTINGKKYDKLYITHADLLKGGVWEFKMGTSPNKKRGQKAENKPYSLTNGIK